MRARLVLALVLKCKQVDRHRQIVIMWLSGMGDFRGKWKKKKYVYEEGRESKRREEKEEGSGA